MIPWPNERSMILSLCDYSGTWSRPYIEHGHFVLRVDPKLSLTEVDHGDLGYGAEGDGSFYQMKDGGWALAITVGELADGLEEQGGYFLDSIYERRVQTEEEWTVLDTRGLLMAPPCTDFSVSGARWFKEKDADGRTERSIQIVKDCMRVKEVLQPEWWVLENPKGRIARLCPTIGNWRMHFHPADYAGFANHPEREAYTKDTYLYGDFNTNLMKAPEPIQWFYDKKGNRGSWQWKNLGGKSERTKELRSMTPQGFSKAFAAANP